MQISKTLLTCGAVALCLVANSARAVDTEADIKLREALRQRMAEVGPEQDTPAKPVKPAKVKAPKAPKAAKAAPAPVVTEPAPVVTPAPVAAKVEVEAAPAPVVYQATPAVPASVSSEEDRLREAVRARLAAGETSATVAQPVVTNGDDLQPVVTTTTVVAPSTPAPAPVAPAPASAPVSTKVITAPASPIPASKEQRLAALLQQYKADLITPQQYHEERAKILAE